MKRSEKKLIGFSIQATDGHIGKVEDFYFDDHHWTVRYMVVNTGSWLLGRRVLISPVALLAPDWESRHFPVTLTMDQVRHSPDIDTDKPVFRQHEAELHEYYAWPVYWEMGPCIPGVCTIPPPPPVSLSGAETQAVQPETARKADPNLRSTRQVTGYRIQARDGELGHVEDFILDDERWDIRFLVVDTRNWLPGRKVLVPPRFIERVSWEDAKVFTALSRETVRNGPEYEPGQPIDLDLENKLRDAYGEPGA